MKLNVDEKEKQGPNNEELRGRAGRDWVFIEDIEKQRLNEARARGHLT